jgi:hypothetical protein
MTMPTKRAPPTPEAEPIVFDVTAEEWALHFERSFKQNEEALRRLAKL